VLTFRVFGIPVTVRPTFLLVAALLGLSTGRPSLVAAWVGIVFVSILVHELGHALTARAYGATVEIELNGIGGLTSWSATEADFGPGRRAAVAAAGSAVGVLFGGLIWLAGWLTGPFSNMAGFVVTNLVWVNVFWGLLNWLPIRPLDGGHLLVSLLQKVTPTKANRISNAVFLLTSIAALAAALWLRLYFIAFFAGWLLMGEMTRGGPARSPTSIPPMSFDRPDPEPETGIEPVEPEPEQADG
jgi:Zn-dependent protease